MMKLDINEKDVLILIDIQNDFMPGGALAVPDGEDILPAVDMLARKFDNIVLTQDWHPAGHKSFASAHPDKEPFEMIEMPYGQQILWPDHCVQGGWGSDFRLPMWIRQKAQMVIKKGFRPEIDSYSAIFENDMTTATGLAGYMKDRGLKRAFFAGLATDFCVAFSALDARKVGFEATLLTEACRGIDPKGVAAQINAMKNAGVEIQ